ncbi:MULTISPECIES: class I fructose-bisphosphate aldolase [Sorangium]|uniref:Fructose-bisphosphate aldolase n=1 Tax=Sorangium cellulosum TaxID=56 RepID=A0A4P2QM26_SORCE|nr:MULTISPECIES: aldolase [Sorangium]AUX30553.1 fructose-bisphosphate aldolase [Sorangium cellulosum]WCQ89948.1 2-amino-4,5-dihydroxy-6-oxo-7-(phosphonooxy)heptanoate synthase [Sorangium sp. Soce836]
MNGFPKKIRWSRFLDRRCGRGIIVPIDHGLTIGPVEGLDSIAQVARWIGHPGITGIIAHKGMVERLASHGLLRGAGVMIHLNGMTSLAPNPNTKERLTSVEAALRLGADAVSLQLNFDGTNDAHNLSQLGEVVDEAQRCGVPVLTMLYDKVPSEGDQQRLTRLRHLMRACVELGTDALKLEAPTQFSHMSQLLAGVVEHTAVFVAGGAVRSEDEVLQLAQEVVARGATGLCVGRNIFQRESASAVLTQLQRVVLGGGEAPPSEPPRSSARAGANGSGAHGKQPHAAGGAAK